MKSDNYGGKEKQNTLSVHYRKWKNKIDNHSHTSHYKKKPRWTSVSRE